MLDGLIQRHAEVKLSLKRVAAGQFQVTQAVDGMRGKGPFRIPVKQDERFFQSVLGQG